MAKILYSIRNLDYTLPRLLLVCTMMLLANKTLGLICYTLVPSVKPILLDRVGASATDIALIISTIPSVLTFVLCPLISTISDKTRTRIGRRQPYLIFSALIEIPSSAIHPMPAQSTQVLVSDMCTIPDGSGTMLVLDCEQVFSHE